MDSNSKKIKKVITFADYISISFGICGVLFGILSLCATASFWSQTEALRNKDAFIFTLTTLVVDSISVVAALISFFYGYKIYKTLNKNETDLVKAKLVSHEQNSFIFDMASFLIGIMGMSFGLTSLLTITPWPNDKVSKIVTGVGIIMDTFSSIMIVFALSEYHKYNNIREIAIHLRERDLWYQLSTQINLHKLKVTPKHNHCLPAKKAPLNIAHRKNNQVNKNRVEA